MPARSTIPLEIKQQILERVKAGTSVAEAARDAGVNTRAIYSWLARQTTNQPGKVNLMAWKKERATLYNLIGQLTCKLSKLEKKLC